MKNSEIQHIIDEYIHKKTHREILRDRWIDGLTFEKLAERHDYSVRQVKRIVHKYDYLLEIINKQG